MVAMEEDQVLAEEEEQDGWDVAVQVVLIKVPLQLVTTVVKAASTGTTTPSQK